MPLDYLNVKFAKSDANPRAKTSEKKNDQIRFCVPKEKVCVFLQKTDSNINFQFGLRDSINNIDKEFDKCCKTKCGEDQACASTPTGDCECWDVEFVEVIIDQ